MMADVKLAKRRHKHVWGEKEQRTRVSNLKHNKIIYYTRENLRNNIYVYLINNVLLIYLNNPLLIYMYILYVIYIVRF